MSMTGKVSRSEVFMVFLSCHEAESNYLSITVHEQGKSVSVLIINVLFTLQIKILSQNEIV